MKKTIILVLAVISFIFYISNKEETIVIPSDAIRFRILANSNSAYDQNVKENVKVLLQDELYKSLNNSKSVTEAKTNIKESMPIYSKILDKALLNEKYSYNIDYGMHMFPEKTYKGVKYKEGEYESLLVTLGEGKGDNWWCVLFPPLCVLEAEETTTSKVEYKFFIKELLEKYF